MKNRISRLLKLPDTVESTERKTGNLTTKAPRHQGMQMGTRLLCQFFLVPLCTPQGGIEKNLGGKNWFGHRVFSTAC
jgi:hypothetical protein